MKSIKDALSDYASILTDGQMVDTSHFYDFRQNIFPEEMEDRFKKMFLAGDGNELVSKACAVNSSSMLGYNFFHWIKEETPMAIDGIIYDTVLFEVKIPVLKGTTPANMDIVLKNGSGDYLFIESKFLEYLNSNSFKISDTYKNKADKYYYAGDRWTRFISEYDVHMKEQYWDGIKQEICHMIGLTNWLNHETVVGNCDHYEPYTDRGNISFINLVFEPNQDYKIEHERFNSYKARYEELHNALKDNSLIPDKLKIGFKTYSDLWRDLTSSNIPVGLKEYLYEHYMKFAENVQN